MSKVLKINDVSVSDSIVKTKRSSKKTFLLTRIINNLSAKKQANRIMQALDEAEQIHSGRKSAKSLGQFIKEL